MGITKQQKANLNLLSKSDKSIIYEMSYGLSMKDVGRRLNIPPGTINTKLYRLYKRFGVNNFVGLLCAIGKVDHTGLVSRKSREEIELEHESADKIRLNLESELSARFTWGIREACSSLGISRSVLKIAVEKSPVLGLTKERVCYYEPSKS